MAKSIRQATPAQVILLGFAGLILVGTLLLMLPFATRGAGSAPFEDALFTAVSATCVTGLIVHDTFTYWSMFGQAVILILIQIGGMGVITMALLVSLVTGRRINMRARFIMQESISAPQMGGIVRLTGFIAKTTLLVEGTGAVLLASRFVGKMPLGQAIWYAVFHAISAFCNAGFDLMGQYSRFSSLTGYAGDVVVNMTIMALIIIGGIGFFVLSDMLVHGSNLRRYSLQTKIVLIASAVLLVLPALYFYFYEFQQPTWQHLTGGQKVMAAAFQSVTTRTAGFNTVNLAELQSPSVMIMTLLMLVGGSPGGTAGGFKTTTLVTLLLSARSTLLRNGNPHAFQRRLSNDNIMNAATLVLLYTLLFLTGGLVLCIADGIPLDMALFEASSAVGTVGLSLGCTPTLGAFSRAVLIALMYLGRVGGLTLAFAFANHRTIPVRLVEEKIAIG